jgi:gamma-butyrobetaine dioxygenase/trimethyllysine dioxygenase
MSVILSPPEPVTLFDGWLRVTLSTTTSADFHYRWLRNNCNIDRHPVTLERTVCSSELPDALRVERAWISAEALRVVWANDGRESVYPLAWLDAHAYAKDRAGSAPSPPPSDVASIEIDARGLDLDAQVERALSLARERGAALVRRVPGETRAPEEETERIIDRLAARGLNVIGTHFGRIEDLRADNTTNQNTDQLGYTDAAIGLHTDQPFLDRPPRYQLLQSIRVADEGGESALVDGQAAAAWLRSTDRASYELLLRTSVTFHRKQRHFESVVRAPLLGEGEGGRFLIRYSYFTLAPHALPFDEMEAFYRAYDRFARLVRDPRHQLRFLLRGGDFLLYENHRMLHARTSFRGPRWVRGVYFDEPR